MERLPQAWQLLRYNPSGFVQQSFRSKQFIHSERQQFLKCCMLQWLRFINEMNDRTQNIDYAKVYDTASQE